MRDMVMVAILNQVTICSKCERLLANLGQWQRRYDMRHEMLTPFLPSRQYKTGHAESAFRDACCTSSGPMDLIAF